MLEAMIQDCLTNRDSVALVSVLNHEGLTASMLTRLDHLVTKELTSFGFSRVVIVLKTLGILSENNDNLHQLLNHGLTTKVMFWFEALLILLTSDRHKNAAPVLSLMEEFYDYFLLLGQSSIEVSQLSVVLLQLGRSALETGISFGLRLEAIRTFNSILESRSKPERKRIQNDEHHGVMLNQMAAAVLTAGDYELQVSLSEALCRLTPRKDREQRANGWFSCSDISRAFCRIRDADFEVDCRSFLNFVNSNHGGPRRVYTFPCLRAFLGSTELFRPKDEKLDDFWIDFNISSECVSFFVDEPHSFLWGSIHLMKQAVNRYSLQVKHGECTAAKTILSVHLIDPIMHNNCTGRTVRLTFCSEHHTQVEEAAWRVFKKLKSLLQPEVGGETFVLTPSSLTWKKVKTKSQLKVLPLSSPSSGEDYSEIKIPRRSMAELLFDRIRESTPMKGDMHDSGFPLEVDLESSINEETEEAVRQEVQYKEKGVCSTDRKRAAPQSEKTESSSVNKRKSPLHEADSVLQKRREEEGPVAEDEGSVAEEEGSVAEEEGSVAEQEGPVVEEEGPVAEEVESEKHVVAKIKSQLELPSMITAAFKTFREKLQEHFTVCWQKVEAEVHASQNECQQQISALLRAVHQQRLLLLENWESKFGDHLNQLEEHVTHLTTINTQIQTFFQSEVQRMTSFCDEQQQRLRSLAAGQRTDEMMAGHPSSQ
ncbi:synaptonemal complex protein 2-like isoform X2 [Genypterus blacodes]|uniref:synaptonemal complex protein 2-like isoform X2 n=1 Tax=Genypterus blacodes TaxID=154954 RepID=UPI003F773ADB